MAAPDSLLLHSAFITSHFLPTPHPTPPPPQHTKDCHQTVVVRLWRASLRRHAGLRGPWLPRLRQSEVSNEYTCVVCSREDTGRNRASWEDEYWVNVLSWERAPLPAPQPQRPVLLVSVWLVNINIYTAVTIRIYRTFSALHVRDT